MERTANTRGTSIYLGEDLGQMLTRFRGNTIASIFPVKRFYYSRRSAQRFANLRIATAEIDFAQQPAFSYRTNKDGSVDSICMNCYLTAATGSTSEELSEQELSHLGECGGNNYAERVIPASTEQGTSHRS